MAIDSIWLGTRVRMRPSFLASGTCVLSNDADDDGGGWVFFQFSKNRITLWIFFSLCYFWCVCLFCVEDALVALGSILNLVRINGAVMKFNYIFFLSFLWVRASIESSGDNVICHHSASQPTSQSASQPATSCVYGIATGRDRETV